LALVTQTEHQDICAELSSLQGETRLSGEHILDFSTSVHVQTIPMQ